MNNIKISTLAHFTNLLNTHGPEKILSIIENGLYAGCTMSVIRDTLCKELNDNIPPRVLPLLINIWFPTILDMTTKERKQWFSIYWPILKLEERQWARLYDPNHPVYKHFTRVNQVNYQGQKFAAKKRGITFELDFISWVVWWIQTGHFDERGVHNHEYQMCRKGDIGPYSWDNIYCDTGENNKKVITRAPVIVNGVTYSTQEDAATALGVARSTISRMLKK